MATATSLRYKCGHPPKRCTRAGWPRPTVQTNIGRLPVPWSAPPNQLSTNAEPRATLAASGKICQVCGLPHKKGQSAFVFVNDKRHRWQRGIKHLTREDIAHMELTAMDRAVMHWRCAVLAATMCPKLRRMQATWRLAVFSVPSHSGHVFAGTRVRWVTDRIAPLDWVRHGRAEPYTDIGIARLPCFRCGRQAETQWQVCADGRLYRPLCHVCDIALNAMALHWLRHPQASELMVRYKKTMGL